MLSFNASSGEFEATVSKDSKVLSINVHDSFFPPFEAGELWKSIRGSERYKYVETNEFFMECQALPDNTGEMSGNCTILIPMELFQKISEKLVLKLTGAQAAKLNRYFVNSAYVSIQRNKVHLSSYNILNQFFFGISEDLIKK